MSDTTAETRDSRIPWKEWCISERENASHLASQLADVAIERNSLRSEVQRLTEELARVKGELSIYKHGNLELTKKLYQVKQQNAALREGLRELMAKIQAVMSNNSEAVCEDCYHAECIELKEALASATALLGKEADPPAAEGTGGGDVGGK